MANNIIKRVWNQGCMTPIEDLQGSAFTNENGGHTFQISGVDSNGESLALSGTVAASFLRPDQTTVGISGSVSGGVASVTLSEECYGIPGRFGLVIFLTSDGKKTAIYSCVGNVARSSTDAVAPGVAADVVDLINEIETAVGTIPASYSALMADIAPTYSSSALYAVGDYAWYEGDLKRCIVPITVGETYTPAHWTSAVVGDDVCALKSAINSLTFEDRHIPSPVVLGYLDSNGDVTSSNKWVTFTDYIQSKNDCWIKFDALYRGIICTYNSSYVKQTRDVVAVGTSNFIPANTIFRVTVFKGAQETISDPTAYIDKCHVVSDLSVIEKLLQSELIGTTQEVTFDGNDNPTTITHKKNGTTIRTDSFVWGTNTVAETRLLSTGEHITITTNLTTLETTISGVHGGV